MTRGWQDYWHWDDQVVEECGAARDVLEAAGVKIAELRSREHDPPDCEAFLDDLWSGIEVTELLHKPTLVRSIKAMKQRKAGRVPEQAEAYFTWPRDYFFAAIQARIDKKTKKWKGRPYKRHVLVIVTGETYLYRDHVHELLEGTEFKSGFITEVYLGLDYHAADPATKEGGGIPVFRLPLLSAKP